MDLENFILKHFQETGIWLPTGEKYDDDPCGGRDCNVCEIGGCDHGVEVKQNAL